MKILFVHEKTHTGGGQTFVNAYIKILKQRAYQFDLVENTITRRDFSLIFQKKYRYAFLHLYTPKFLFLVIFLKLIGIRIIVTAYGLWFLESQTQSEPLSFEKTMWLKLAQGIIFFCSDTLIALSDYERGLMERYYGFVKNKISVIPGGVDVKCFFPVTQIQKTVLRKKLGFPLHKHIFLVVSRLERRKGIDLAIAAMPGVLKKHPDALLCIVFPTDAFSQIEIAHGLFQQVAYLGIGNNVRFITGVTTNDIPYYYQTSDVFIMSSRAMETFGLTTIEAMASGCLPIGYRSGATINILQQVDHNLLAYPITAGALAQKMLWAVSLSSYKKHSLIYKCITVASQYSWNTVGKKLANVLLYTV